MINIFDSQKGFDNRNANIKQKYTNSANLLHLRCFGLLVFVDKLLYYDRTLLATRYTFGDGSYS